MLQSNSWRRKKKKKEINKTTWPKPRWRKKKKKDLFTPSYVLLLLWPSSQQHQRAQNIPNTLKGKHSWDTRGITAELLTSLTSVPLHSTSQSGCFNSECLFPFKTLLRKWHVWNLSSHGIFKPLTLKSQLKFVCGCKGCLGQMTLQNDASVA